MRYFPYQKLDGILHFLHRGNKDDNSYLITNSDSNHGSSTSQDKAFDFDKSTYWTSGDTSGPAWIYFCLLNYYVKITEFEIQTSSGECRPSKFQFGFLGQNGNYVFKDFQINAGLGVVLHEQYQAPIFSKCFKYVSTETTCSSLGKRTDVVQFEIFGSLIHDSELFQQRCTIQGLYSKLYSVPFMIFLFLF